MLLPSCYYTNSFAVHTIILIIATLSRYFVSFQPQNGLADHGGDHGGLQGPGAVGLLAGRRRLTDISFLRAKKEESVAHGDEFGRSLASKMMKDVAKTTIDVDLQHGSAANPAGRTRRLVDPFWVRLGTDIDGKSHNDESGSAVAFSANGERVAIGGLSNDENGDNAGQVRVYDWTGTEWDQVGVINGDAAGDEFGQSVALSADGSRLAIGAPGHDDTWMACSDKGHVRIHHWNESNWDQVGDAIEGKDGFDLTGYSVAMSTDGNRVIIGSRGSDSFSGHIGICDWTGSAWGQVGADIVGASQDHAGFAVAMSADGSRVVLGSQRAGHVRIYDWNKTDWVQAGNDIQGEGSSDNFGLSVSMSTDGSAVVIGGPFNFGGTGHTRIYDWNTTDWVQVGADIDGEAGGDRAGYAVAMTADGCRVAIGADMNGAFAADAGHVRVYDWNGTDWDQVGVDIHGESAGDRSGARVAIAADGSRLAIAGRYHGDNKEGHVRVYSGQVCILIQLNFP